MKIENSTPPTPLNTWQLKPGQAYRGQRDQLLYLCTEYQGTHYLTSLSTGTSVKAQDRHGQFILYPDATLVPGLPG